MSASRVGPSGEVLAVEPNPANVKLILSSAARNRFSNICVVQAAAYNAWKPLPLFVDSSNGSIGTVDCRVDNTTSNTVMVLPLRAVIGSKKVDLVKIDVEGAEGLAMQGMWDVIVRCKPVVFSEFTPGAMPGMSGMEAEEYIRMFTLLGYRVSVLDKNQGVIDCGTNSSLVMQAFELTNDAHLDVLFEHPTP